MMNYKITTPTQILFVRRDSEGRFIVELGEIDIIMKEGEQTKIIKKKDIRINLENLVAGKLQVEEASIKNVPEISSTDSSVLKINVSDEAELKDKFGQ